jgi:hypothetical protein
MYCRGWRQGAQLDGEAEMHNGTIKPGRRTKIRTKTEKPPLKPNFRDRLWCK